MFELCRAVNEREQAINDSRLSATYTLTQFYKADGTLTTFPTMADLLGMRCSGTNNYAYQNLVKIRNAIAGAPGNFDGLAPHFVESSTGGVAYTRASLAAALGTSLEDDPIRVNEARYWQAMQDALDLLIYLRGDAGASPDTAGYSRHTSIPAPPTPNPEYTTAQDSWDNRRNRTVTGSGSAGGRVSMETTLVRIIDDPGPPATTKDIYNTKLYIDTTLEMDISHIPAGFVVTGGSYRIDWDSEASANINMTVGSDTYTATAGGSGWEFFEWGDVRVTRGTSPVTVGLGFTEPSPVPFSGLSLDPGDPVGTEDTGAITYRITEADVYYDISSELTDQA